MIGPVLLTGSSFFENWTTSGRDLAPLESRNVGIGGTTIGDQLALFDALVRPADPRALVLYAGSNDINGEELSSRVADWVVPRVVDYLRLARRTFPTIPLLYVGITEAPRRANVRGQIRRANRQLRDEAARTGLFRFVDTGLLTPAGEIDRSLFGPDRLHLNERGYARFAPPIRRALLEVLGE